MDIYIYGKSDYQWSKKAKTKFVGLSPTFCLVGVNLATSPTPTSFRR